jgi:perosamine synthetase
MFGGAATNRHAADIAARAINLPSFHDMTDEEQQRVVAVIAAMLDA